MKITPMEFSTPKTRSRPITDGLAKDQIIAHYLPLVRSIAVRIHRRLPEEIDLESLIQSGVIGLIDALARFNPERGVDFELYARFRIQGEVNQYLRSLDWVSRSVRSWQKKIDVARIKLAGTLVREPTAEEMAKELKISLDFYYRHSHDVNGASLLSMESLTLASEIERLGTDNKFYHHFFLDPHSFVENKDLLAKLRTAIETLSERERAIVVLYYYEELTLKKIAEMLRLTEPRISQIIAKIMKQLRAHLDINPRLRRTDAQSAA